MNENGENIEIIKFLIENGYDPNEFCKEGYTTHHIACEFVNIRIISQLIENGADINMKSINNLTPLHICLIYDHQDAAIFLIGKGANPNSFNNHEKSPLCIAIEKSYNDLAIMLIKNGADINEENSTMTPLSLALKIKNKKMISFLSNYQEKTEAEEQKQINSEFEEWVTKLGIMGENLLAKYYQINAEEFPIYDDREYFFILSETLR